MPRGHRGRRAASAGLWRALLFAFLGGLILNLMPCVLPVLSLKVLGFVRQAGETRVLAPRPRVHRGRAGVVLGRWRALLLALRAGGERIGWGFQLQSPAFVAVLAVLFLLIALNLLGVFEVGHVARGRGERACRAGPGSPRRSGAACSRPWSRRPAPRRSWARRSASRSPSRLRPRMLIFTALGLGMAAPYLVLSASPRLLRFVPKPGAWMETFKQLMAVPMLATVVFLCWLLGQQTGVDGDGLAAGRADPGRVRRVALRARGPRARAAAVRGCSRRPARRCS